MGRIKHQIQRVYQHHGVRGLYRGLMINTLGSAASWGGYFVLYEWLKQHSSGIHGVHSAMAGGLVALTTNPIWVMKTRIINYQYTSIRQAIHDLHRNGGWYRGVGWSMVGVSHGAVQFQLYEWLKANHRQRTASPVLVCRCALTTSP